MTGGGVVTLHSSSPSVDAERLEAILSSTGLSIETQPDEIIILVWRDRYTIILVPCGSNEENRACLGTRDVCTPLVVEAHQIRQLLEEDSVGQSASIQGPQNDFITAQVQLPGGAVLLLVTPEMVASSEGRTLLATRIRSREPTVAKLISNGDYTPTRDAALSPLSATISPSNRSTAPSFQTSSSSLFPQLQAHLLQENKRLTDFPINSQIPVPFENEFFQGSALLVIRPSDPASDPYWNDRIFSKKKRRVVIQAQGRFKRLPQGELFAGLELSDEMKLGLLSKGFCNVIIKFIESFGWGLHSSFGDRDGKEKPHLVCPANIFFEQLIATPPGQEPPVLGEEVVESKDHKAARRAGNWTWNTTDTYTMCFHSMYLDLSHWRITSIPVTRDMSLKTFWGKSFLRIVLYESGAPKKESRHLEALNRYFFQLQIKFDKSRTKENREQDDVSESEVDPLAWDTEGSLLDMRSKPLPIRRTESQEYMEGQGLPSISSEDSDDLYFFDAEEYNVDYTSPWNSLRVASLETIASLDKICPAWIEVGASRGRYTKVFAFSSKGKVVLRTLADFEQFFEEDAEARAFVDDAFSHRMSGTEHTRRVLGKTLLNATEQSRSQFESFVSEYDSSFLRRDEPSLSNREKSTTRLTGFVARACSDRHWVEQWTRVTDRYIAFYHPDKGKPALRIFFDSVLDVSRLGPRESPPLSQFSFLVIETVGRSTYLMFLSASTRDAWVDAIAQRIVRDDGSIVSTSQQSTASHLMEVDDLTEEFLHKNSMWNCKQRRVLNCRRFTFLVGKRLDPLDLVEDSLRRAFDPRNTTDMQCLRGFLDSAATLKDVDLQGLQEEERLVFFLNLYHVMIMHAFLVLGTPDSGFKWISYFNTISYQISDDIFSLTELEHCIVRAEMSYPSQFLARFVLPKSHFPFALTKPDFRINFALNCGSVSNPGGVPVYKVSTLNEQLDAATRAYLSQAVTVKKHRSSHDVTIYLPRLCQWFAEDFGSGSSDDVVRILEPFLTSSQQRLLGACWSEKEKRYSRGTVTVKYAQFSFECRPLVLSFEKGRSPSYSPRSTGD